MTLKRHARLTAIYTMLERMRQAEFQLAQGVVARVVAQEEMMECELRAAAFAAQGRGAEQAAARTTFDYARAVLLRLGTERDEAERIWAAAQAAYAESRLQLEQMKVIEAEAQRIHGVELERRMQAAVDDRFGGQRWAREKCRER